MIQYYEKCVERKVDIGKSLWDVLPFCGNPIHYLDYKCQEIIKQYNYSTQFNLPPYRSVQETPQSLLDAFTVIKIELNRLTEEITREKNAKK